MASRDVLESLVRIVEFHSDIRCKQGYARENVHKHVQDCRYELESENPRLYVFVGHNNGSRPIP
jgi:hypothetical protein